jgi:hypothetical protein
MTRRLIMAAAVLALCAGARGDEWGQMIGQTDQVTRGLVAYYSMRNSGTTVIDDFGNFNGVASNGVTFSYASGAVGNGASFVSSSSQFISIDDNNALSFTNNIMSLSVWVKTTATNAPAIVYKSSTISDREYALVLSGINATPSFRIFGGGRSLDVNIINGASSLNDGSWNFVVCVSDGTFLRVFVNGSEDANKIARTQSMGNYTSGLQIGRYGGDSLYYSGQIDELRLYSAALSTDEIRQLYRMGATPRRIRE